MFAVEKVHAMIREIKFLRTEEFEPTIPMLGAWHAEKTMLKFLQIYQKGSAAEFIWLDADVHGPTVIENSFLDAGNYNQAPHGMSFHMA